MERALLPQSLHEWISHMAQHTDERGLSIIFTMLWAIWMRRNRKVFSNYLLSAQQTFDMMYSMLLPDEVRPESNQGEDSRLARWCTPHAGWVKCNLDAAFSPTTGAGFGCLLRDCKTLSF